jgi:hypothetical protein
MRVYFSLLAVSLAYVTVPSLLIYLLLGFSKVFGKIPAREIATAYVALFTSLQSIASILVYRATELNEDYPDWIVLPFFALVFGAGLSAGLEMLGRIFL